jgi:hypothetical protein
VDSIKGGPAEERTMNDRICYVLFVLIVLAFFILGIYVMADQSSAFGQAINNPTGVGSSNVLAVVFSKYPGLIAGMFVLSIAIAVFYLLLVRYCLRCVVYTMVGAVFCIMFAILVLGIYSNNFGLIVTMTVGIFVFGVFLLCMQKEF